MNVPAILGLPAGSEWLLIALVALLLFGRRLPEVARSFGKSIVEFKKGMRDIKEDVESASTDEPKRSLPGADPAPTSKARSDEKAHA
ncbi:MAG: twin-arginine translocase TatA/TatE family subunit [Phycisphaerae bacterium]|nr:MAG: twin-arginine translocase TatA/TatE family subunit [Planctomycetota bacterium]KAB2942160.1 MAG: twin-arginine translocase TatA/TatE family subunit [Phycisphaerae bacterium]MBE7458041.1 twin-arginine translocase TatA/TatE family subunit [Planctomycetia bacterium]MCK6464495.1 twin-arginine translocase TatA/TatE family subunit [Phycisphaerae bacterium]MCL4717955.1 twin-arginine translocase TatA/TatE family subunit [Phycisphaerae bacterium]